MNRSMVTLPTESSLLYPTLAAVQALGGSARKEDIEREVIRSQRFTPAQVAVEFPPTATRRGSVLAVRIAFARTSLKKLLALDNAKTGVWSITDRGERFLREGEAAVIAADKEVRRNRSRGMPEPDLTHRTPDPRPSDFSAQREVEDAVRRALEGEFGPLRPGSKALSASVAADFDGVSSDGTTIVEIFARVRPMNDGQTKQVASDAFKIAAFLQNGVARVGVLAFVDAEAASTATNTSTWLGEAIRSAGIEVRVVNIDAV